MPAGQLYMKSGEVYEVADLRMDGDSIHYIDLATHRQSACAFGAVRTMRGKFLTREELARREADKRLLEARLEKEKGYMPAYPEGIYRTRDEFIAKKPSGHEGIYPDIIDGGPNAKRGVFCYFRYADSGNKVKDVFAISSGGYLYFQLEAVLKNRNKDDHAQTADRANQFVRVTDGGEHYLYFEADLTNAWAQGVGYGLGGVAGGAIASTSGALKGAVWDVGHREFNIFRNCRDFQDFAEGFPNQPHMDCKTHFADIDAVRNFMAKVK